MGESSIAQVSGLPLDADRALWQLGKDKDDIGGLPQSPTRHGTITSGGAGDSVGERRVG